MNADAALYADCVDRFVDMQALPFLVEKGLDRARLSYDAGAVRGRWAAMIADVAAGRKTESLFQLYINVPFCRQLCYFCNLNAVGLRSSGQTGRYVANLIKSIHFFAPTFAGVAFRSLFIGGGTPSILSAAEMDEAFSALRGSFEISAVGERCIEVHPGSFTDDKLEVVARHGINKINFGVQSTDRSVLAGENRDDQDRRDMIARARAIRACKAIRCLNIDLILGLRGDTEAKFKKSFAETADLEPDTITVYPLHPTGPYLSRFYGGSLREFYLAFDRLSPLITGSVREFANTCGYRLETHPDRWYFRRAGGSSADEHGGYADRAAQPVSVLGLGPRARSHVAGTFAYCHRAEVDEPFEPGTRAYRGHEVDPILERLKFVLGELLSSAKISRADFSALFCGDIAECFGAELRALQDAGRLRLEPDCVHFAGADARARLIDALSLIGAARLRAMLDSYNYGNFRFAMSVEGRPWQVWVERVGEGETSAYLLRAGDFGLALAGPRAGSQASPLEAKVLHALKAVFTVLAKRSSRLCADELTLLLQRAMKRAGAQPGSWFPPQGVFLFEPAASRGVGADGKSSSPGSITASAFVKGL